MPYNGSGAFAPLPPPQFPAVAGTIVVSDYFNAVMNDVFLGLGNAITRDGQSPATANLPMSGFKLTGLGTGTATTDSVNLGQVTALLGTGYASVTNFRELQTATAGQTLFTLTTMSYTVGTAGLWVIQDGIVLPQSDYTQTSTTSVTFAVAKVGGEQIEFVTSSFAGYSTTKTAAADSAATATDYASYQFRRNVNFVGGTPGSVNACVRADTYVYNAGATDYEWALVGVIQNYATAGQNVGAYFQGNKRAAGPTWGAVSEVIDWFGANPTSGVVGLEVDVSANGTDSNNNRLGIDIVARRQGGVGTAMAAAWGVRLQHGGDASAQFAVGFDTSLASIGQAAYKMAQGQVIAFTSTASRKLFYDGAGFRFSDISNVPLWNFNDDGSVVVAGASGITMADSALATLFKVQRVASAVNYVQVNNAVAGIPAGFYASGADANQDISMQGQGTGGVRLNDGGTNVKLQVNATGIGLYGVAPTARATTAIASSAFVANAGTAINTLSTFDGFTIPQIVKALRNLGALS